MNKKILAGVGIVIVVVLSVGILMNHSGANKSDSSGTMSQAVKTNSITIKNYMFAPMVVQVKVGTKVTWTNQDAVGHTITADKPMGGAPNSMSFGEGETYSFTFKTVGTYTYHCFPHPYMHGTIVVTE